MMRIAPTSSYHLPLPEEVLSDEDSHISSFWIGGQPLLLQVSSHLRSEGEQVTAKQRLNDRMVKYAGSWNPLSVHVNREAPDQAAAETIDSNNVAWLHAYLVWPHLAIYATISGPSGQVNSESSWARLALMKLELAFQ
jgi:hypothetical protein